MPSTSLELYTHFTFIVIRTKMLFGFKVMSHNLHNNHFHFMDNFLNYHPLKHPLMLCFIQVLFLHKIPICKLCINFTSFEPIINTSPYLYLNHCSEQKRHSTEMQGITLVMMLLIGSLPSL